MDANPRPPQLERLIHGTGAKLRLEPRTDRPLTVFLHIPKTAGTTFSEILYDNFPASGIGRTGNVFRGGGGMVPGKLAQLQASAHLITRNVDVLWGHIPYGLAPYLPADARYLTFLRHPVARTLSHYENIRELGIVDRDASLEALVDSGDVVDDLQTRMLCGDETPFGPVTRDMLDRAKRNLTDELHVFGLTERFDESLALMRDRIGLSSILYVQHRVASRRTDGPPPGLVEAAAAVNQHDLELYEHAVRVFDEVIAGEGDSFRLNLEALRRALDPRAERKPAADDLWQLALDGREELLVRNYELAQFRRRYATALDREEMSASLGELQRAMAELTGRVDQFENRVAKMLGVAGPTRARAVAKLERVEEEIAELEAGPDLDEEAALRLDRLRRGAEALRSEAEAPDSAVEPDPDIVLAEPPAPAIAFAPPAAPPSRPPVSAP